MTRGPLHLAGRLLYGNDEVFARFHAAATGGTALKDISAKDALEVLRMQHEILERKRSLSLMKILLVTHYYSTHAGGIEIVAGNTGGPVRGSRMTSSGWPVTVTARRRSRRIDPVRADAIEEYD